MGKVDVGINLEFMRDRPFEVAMDRAAALGFEYVEPMVHWGRELLSAAGYFHSVSMLDDPLRLSRAAAENGLRISALSAHAPLCRPEISTEYLKQAARYAGECGAPGIITDDGPDKPAWATREQNDVLMRHVLEEATAVAAPRDVWLGLECHGEYTATPGDLARTLGLVDSPALVVNFDTGNAFLSGNDPHDWLDSIVDRVAHVHAKDISHEDAARYRGKVRGMLGCACGDGVIDWERIVRACAAGPRDIVLSVECGSVEDAERSLDHLRGVIRRVGRPAP
jgi:sugar phosphate isomerase/epimerase